ncbi:hypothetical protein [Burkholderia sp. 9120]|uniref:hypothetical protein n=1 Tax=Burkholderia sp. 9120 TaxID=1500897 RepID=UPI00054E6EB0|nr:hypothetical protein [Burkholderia sp. 9120]
MPESKANEVLIAAIKNTDWKKERVAYGEIALSLSSSLEFAPFWAAFALGIQTHGPVFYRFNPMQPIPTPHPVPNEILPVGDLMRPDAWITMDGHDPVRYQPAPPTFFLSPTGAPSPNGQPALAHPVSFTWLCDDAGSDNPNKVIYYRLDPPPGYVALGICFSPDMPRTQDYWCVREDLCLKVAQQNVWNDSGYGWDDNGDVEASATTLKAIAEVPEGNILLSPLGYTYSTEQAYMLNLPAAFLDVTFDFPQPPQPSPTAQPVTQQRTDAGLSNAFIVPFNMIPADSDFPDQAYNSPFYFVAAQPYYLCYRVISPTGGGQITVTYDQGVTAEDSTTFESTTSIEASVSVGAQWAVENASASLSMTQTFGLTVNATYTQSSEYTYQEQLTFPPEAFVYQWQLMTDLVVMRADCSQIRSISFANADYINDPPPVPPAPSTTPAPVASH